MMNDKCKLITPENIQGEVINNEIEQINLRVQAFKEQKYNELLKENQELKKENKILRENAEHNDKVVDKVNWENKKLKKQLEENKDKINWYENFEINKTIDKLRIKHNNQQKAFIEFLENEEDRLARECSHIYEDSLGKARLVNEDIFNEVDKILSKYEKIIGGKE